MKIAKQDWRDHRKRESAILCPGIYPGRVVLDTGNCGDMCKDHPNGALPHGVRTAGLEAGHKITRQEESFSLGARTVRSIHTPGHSPGSVVYVVESEGTRILFGQDVHGPLDPSLLSNPEDYLNFVRFLLTLDIDILCECHFGIFRGRQEIHDFIKAFLC